MKKKIMLMLTLCALSGQATMKPLEKTPTSTHIKRGVAVYLGLPEYQLSLKNALLNGLPWYARQALRTSSVEKLAKGTLKRMSIAGNSHAKVAVDCLDELAKILLKKRAPSEPKSSQTKKARWIPKTLRLLYCLRSYVGETHLLHILLPGLRLGQKIKSMVERRRILATLTNNPDIIASRTIPAHMLEKDYLVFQSSLGHAIRDIDSLCMHVLSVLRDLNRINCRVRNGIDEIDMTGDKEENTLKSALNFIKNNALGITLTKEVPFAKHLYILKIDFKKLTPEQQQELFKLIVQDTHHAVKAIANMLKESGAFAIRGGTALLKWRL